MCRCRWWWWPRSWCGRPEPLPPPGVGAGAGAVGGCRVQVITLVRKGMLGVHIGRVQTCVPSSSVSICALAIGSSFEEAASFLPLRAGRAGTVGAMAGKSARSLRYLSWSGCSSSLSCLTPCTWDPDLDSEIFKKWFRIPCARGLGHSTTMVKG